MAEQEISAGNLHAGTEFLEQALAYNNWRLVYRNQAIMLHTETLLKRKQFQTLVDLYGGEDQWLRYLDEPQILLLVAEGLHRNGDSATPAFDSCHFPTPR